MTKDAFDLWQEWANKPADSDLTISADIHGPVMTLDPEDRKDREMVNFAVRSRRDPDCKITWKVITGEHSFKGFDTEEEGRAWMEANDPEGVLWKVYHGPRQPAGSANKNNVPKAQE
jgi:hypothetical protein